MSLIIKSQNGREAEVSNKWSTMVKHIGIEEEMTKEQLENTLKASLVHVMSKGDVEGYHKLSEVLSEVATWDSSTVHIQY